jgi:hypothetical protein
MLEVLVDFYRAVGRPQICDMQFEVETILTAELHQQVNRVDHSSLGLFKEIILDGDEISSDEIRSEEYGKTLRFRYKVGTGDSAFYKDVTDLLRRNTSLNRGGVNAVFYVAEDDYFSTEGPASNGQLRYKQLQSIVALIHELKELAHYHDAKAGKEQLHLVFVRDSDGGSVKSLQLAPQIDLQLLDAPSISIESVTAIGHQAAHNPHSGRETSVFRTSLIEFLSYTVQSSENKFSYLVLHWSEFIQLFKKNFDTYISGFAFHKVRKEVADAEIAAADQLSKIFNDISGKILGIPLSFASLVLIVKTENTFERLVLALSTLLVSWLLAELMHNQQLQLGRLKDARSLLFDEIKVKAADYPDGLKSKILSAAYNLDQNESKVTRLLQWLRAISWLPAIAAACLLLHLNSNDAYYSVEKVINLFRSLTEFTVMLFL